MHGTHQKKECRILQQSVGLRPFGINFCGKKWVWQSVTAPPKNETGLDLFLFCCHTLLCDMMSHYSTCSMITYMLSRSLGTTVLANNAFLQIAEYSTATIFYCTTWFPYCNRTFWVSPYDREGRICMQNMLTS